MNILTLNTFLHTPCCPKIFPQNSPCTQIQKGNFSLQTPDRLDQGSVLTNYFSLESQHHENELENMGRILVNEEEDTTMNGKRSFEEFMGKKNHRASIFRALTLLQNGRKPCKRALF